MNQSYCMAEASPIPGAGDHNGIRSYHCDTAIEDITGIPMDPKNPPVTVVTAQAPTPDPASITIVKEKVGSKGKVKDA